MAMRARVTKQQGSPHLGLWCEIARQLGQDVTGCLEYCRLIAAARVLLLLSPRCSSLRLLSVTTVGIALLRHRDLAAACQQLSLDMARANK